MHRIPLQSDRLELVTGQPVHRLLRVQCLPAECKTELRERCVASAGNPSSTAGSGAAQALRLEAAAAATAIN